MSDKTKAVLIIVLAAMIGGAVSPVVKIGLREIPPFSFSFIRFFLASLFLFPLILKSKIKFDRNIFSLIFVSLLSTANIALFAFGIKLTSPSVAQFLYAGTPIMAGIFSYVILKQRLSLKKWLFITLGLIGVCFVIFLPLIEKNSFPAGNVTGNILITIGMILWSLYFVYSKQYQRRFSPLAISSVFIFTSTVVFFFFSLIELKTDTAWFYQLSSISLYALLYVSLFGTIGSYFLAQSAIKLSDPIIASLSYYFLPIFTYFSSFILLEEKLTPGLIVGTVLVFISVTLTTYSQQN